MQNWFLLALISPLLWSIVAHLDRYIIAKRLQERGVGVLLLSSSLFSILVVPIIFLFTKDPFSLPLIQKVIFILIGFASLVAVALNLYALEEEEASIVVPFMQLIPVFGHTVLQVDESIHQAPLYNTIHTLCCFWITNWYAF